MKKNFVHLSCNSAFLLKFCISVEILHFNCVYCVDVQLFYEFSCCLMLCASYEVEADANSNVKMIAIP